jgi:plasmid stabilization system protein ParE
MLCNLPATAQASVAVASRSRRALADLEKAGGNSRVSFGSAAAQAVERRIREVVARIAGAPESVRELSARPGVHVVPLVKYPYKIFDEIVGETIEIWPAPGSEDTELGVLMEPEVDHGEAEVHAGVQD